MVCSLRTSKLWRCGRLIRETINHIKESLPEYFITDQPEAFRILLRAKSICFLDTCFVSRLIFLAKEVDIYTAFEKMAGGRDKEDIVFVITELVLYELKDSKEPVLQSRNRELFKNINANGFTIIVITEESVCENINTYVSKSKAAWNSLLLKYLAENKANMSKLFSVMRDSGDSLQESIYDGTIGTVRQTDFIFELISGIKERKCPEDSLAEELIGVSLFFVLELIKDSNRNAIYFCSHDLPAIDRFNKVIRTSFSGVDISIKTISFFSFIAYMVENGLILDREYLVNILDKTFGKVLNVIETNESVIQPTPVQKSADEVSRDLIGGVKLVYVGKVLS